MSPQTLNVLLMYVKQLVFMLLPTTTKYCTVSEGFQLHKLKYLVWIVCKGLQLLYICSESFVCPPSQV